MDDQPLLTVVYQGEPDEVFEFHEDLQSRTFGRDDSRCDIVIWSAINGQDLSRVAGRVWRMDDELWIRNLSTRHELRIEVPGEPGLNVLPVRRADGIDRGPARGLPAPIVYVRGPGGCDLEIRQRRAPQRDRDNYSTQEPTTRLPLLGELSPNLPRVAMALCRPILAGALLPAPHAEVARELGVSLKQARSLVAALCRVYEREIPEMRAKADAADLDALDVPPAPTRGRDGVYRFAQVPQERDQPKPTSVPDSLTVAHVLVRHRIVTVDHVS